MTDIVSIVPRTRPLRAMRFILGTTRKSDIRGFCPRANVGVLAIEGVDQEKDIRWVAVPHNGDLWDRVEHDGDWIVEVAPDHWVIKSDTDFHREYVIA